MSTPLDPAARHLVLDGVSKRFVNAKHWLPVLNNVSLELAAGGVGVIVGASGCGKSTLLRLIAGLEQQDAGQITIDGEEIRGPGRDRGVVFQEHRLFPWLTVAENVAFGLSHLPKADHAAIVGEYIASVGLVGFEHSYPDQLSGGMAQRAALARALAPKPRLLLLDEPFAALDAFTKANMQSELLRIQQLFGSSLLLVTHDIEEAVFLGDRVHVLSQRPGQIRCTIDVNLEHPRDRTSAEFSHFRRSVLDELQRDQPASTPATAAENQAQDINRSYPTVMRGLTPALSPRES